MIRRDPRGGRVVILETDNAVNVTLYNLGQKLLTNHARKESGGVAAETGPAVK